MDNENIKEILEESIYCKYELHTSEKKKLLDYITNLENEQISKYQILKDLQEENERLKEQNNDLRKIYRNTYNRLFEKGNDELARYFQAQIDDCPTFYVEPIIDYHKEWLEYKQRNGKAIEYLANCDWNCKDFENLYDILGGDDNE